LLTIDRILGGFGDKKQSAQLGYRQFLSAGKGQPSPWEQLKNQIYLGFSPFVEDMQCRIDPKPSLDDIPKPQKQLPVKPLVYYEERYGVRDRSMAEAYRSGHYILKEVGEHFSVSYATVSRALNEFDV